MFGYVVANQDALDQEQRNRYKAFYCGLCHALKARHGQVSRATLNYDMAFLVILLTSVSGAEPPLQKERCFLHPTKPHGYYANEYSDYGAAMNVALAYFNQLDNWQDDKQVLSLAEARLLKKEYEKTARIYDRQCRAISEGLSRLSAYEADGELNPDLPAQAFGGIMGALFDKNGDSPELFAFGQALGRFIYIMDAAVDFKRDLKRQHYNPLTATPTDSHRAILNMLMADCTACFDALQVTQDKALLENILYSGVWVRYEAMNAANKGGKPV